MLLPREIRRKLAQLGQRGKQEPQPSAPATGSEDEPRPAARDTAPGREPSRAAGGDTPASAIPPAPAPTDAEPGSTFRQRLKERLRESFGPQEPDGPERPFGPARELGQVLAGEVVENELGPLYVARRLAADVMPLSGLAERLVETLQRSDLPMAHQEFGMLAGTEPSKVLFLDTETTGLASVPLFLCGTMGHGDDGLAIEQMLARDYAEEPALLRHVQSVLEATEVLVTYNGRTFDLPFIHDRMVYHLIDYTFAGQHLDLLPHARRLYRGVFPDCKLQTLEVRLCGFPERTGDIPGEDIPQAYHDFVATSNAGILAPIFEHNARDLVALCDILVRIIAEGTQ